MSLISELLKIQNKLLFFPEEEIVIKLQCFHSTMNSLLSDDQGTCDSIYDRSSLKWCMNVTCSGMFSNQN